MRVLVWSDFHVTHGDELDRQTGALVHRLTERHDVLAVADTLGPAVDTELPTSRGAVRIHRLPMSTALHRRDPAAILGATRTTRRIVGSWRPDAVVHELTGTGAFFLPRALDATTVPVFVRAASPPSADAKVALGPLLRRAVHWAAPSAVALALWREAIAGEAEHRPSLEFGVRHPLLGLGPPPDPPADGDGLVIAGRCVAGKGIDLAIDALAMLRAEGVDTTLAIVGDGPERASLQRRVDDHGLGDRVTITGWLPRREVIERMRGAAVVLAPSQVMEAFGAVAMEAAWCGRPAVVTRVGGLPEAVHFGRSGVIVEPGDLEALAGAIADLLADPARARQLGASGAVLAARHDSHVMAGLLDLLDRIDAGSLPPDRRRHHQEDGGS